MHGWSRTHIGLIAGTLLLATFPHVQSLKAQSPGEFRIEATRDKVKEWLETERTYAAEAHDWELEQASLKDRIRLLTNELADLEEEVERARATATEADQRRAELRRQEEALRTTSQQLEAIVTEAEGILRVTLPMLPEPLLEEVRPLIQRVPKDASRTSLTISQRVQNIVGILTQTDRFNNGVTEVSAIQDLPSGAKVEVRTLYFGLGVAYFADPEGRYSGYGYPTLEGWKWEEDPSLASAIIDALAMYENTKPAELTPLPVTVR